MDNKEKIKKLYQESSSLCNMAKEIYGFSNGTTLKKLYKELQKINISREDVKNRYYESKRKYKRVEKECPVCEEIFIVEEGSPREKQTCSYACSNTMFRSGEDNGNWSPDSYRSTCFLYHEKKCVCCEERNIVEVHHYDEDNTNNSPENLIPLCPTHHQYWHSKYRNLVQGDVVEYRNNFLNERGIK